MELGVGGWSWMEVDARFSNTRENFKNTFSYRVHRVAASEYMRTK